jgi:hypothetical protein
MLARNGFAMVYQYDMDGNNFIPDRSLNMLTIAKKQ